MLVDEIFALYLYRMSNRINKNYYRIVLAYVIFFRECLNEYGWGKKIESEGIKLESNLELKQDIEKGRDQYPNHLTISLKFQIHLRKPQRPKLALGLI